jgi:hypothetical protein
MLRQIFSRRRVYNFSLAFSDEEYEAMHGDVCNQQDMRDLVRALWGKA